MQMKKLKEVFQVENRFTKRFYCSYDAKWCQVRSLSKKSKWSCSHWLLISFFFLCPVNANFISFFVCVLSLHFMNTELNDFNGHSNIHLHTNVLHAIRLAFYRLFCGCLLLTFVRRRGYYLWDFFWYFSTSTTLAIGHATSTNNETYFYGENRLIRNEMISIKMFSLLVAIQLSVFLVCKRFKVEKNVTHAKNVFAES